MDETMLFVYFGTSIFSCKCNTNYSSFLTVNLYNNLLLLANCYLVAWWLYKNIMDFSVSCSFIHCFSCVAFILLEPESSESDEGFELVDWPYPAPTPERGSWPHPS